MLGRASWIAVVIEFEYLDFFVKRIQVGCYGCGGCTISDAAKGNKRNRGEDADHYNDNKKFDYREAACAFAHE